MAQAATNRDSAQQDLLFITLFSIPPANMAIVRTRVRELRDSLVGPMGVPTGCYVGILDGHGGIPYKVVLAVDVGSPTDRAQRPHCANVLDSMVWDRILFDLDELEPASEEELEVKEKLRNRFVDDFGINP